ncbi:MAG: GNAT family N-acetyltransferase [Planctomycetes bacterium]|nr:GNAT family N-acetyltransferase [Planctomycetota bacterium]
MSLIVRPMRPEETERVMEIDCVAFGDLQEKLTGRPFDLPMREREFFEFWQRADPEGALVAEKDGAIIGINFNHARRRSGWFGPLAVAPGEQSAGAGKALLQAGMEYLAGARCRMIGLDTYPHNPVAVSMYLKNGFEVVGSTVQLEIHLPIERLNNEGANPRAGDSSAAVEPIGAEDMVTIIGTEEELSGFNRAKDFSFLLEWDHAFGLRVSDGTDLAGYLWGYRKRGKGVIGSFYVADENQYREVGCPLLDAAFEEFLRLGLSNIVSLNDGNQSKQLNFLFGIGFRTRSTMLKLHLGDIVSRRTHSPLASEKG